MGLVPIENSIEGSITVTLDTLAFDTDLLVQREIDLPVSLHLCAKTGTALADVKHRALASRARSRSAGCGSPSKLPEADSVAANSTAEAARQVAASKRTDVASIGTVAARSSPGSRSSQSTSRTTRRTSPGSWSSVTASPARRVTTRRRSCASSARTVRARCSRSSRSSRARAINLTKLESRPTKRNLGDYCFFIDFDGHVADELVADCLRNLVAKQAEVKFLGSYPVAGDERPATPPCRDRRPGDRPAAGSTTSAAQVRAGDTL